MKCRVVCGDQRRLDGGVEMSDPMTREADNFAVLGIFLDAVGQVLGPFSPVERATRRAMFTNDDRDLQDAEREFDSLPGGTRRQVAHKAEDRAYEVVAKADAEIGRVRRQAVGKSLPPIPLDPTIVIPARGPAGGPTKVRGNGNVNGHNGGRPRRKGHPPEPSSSPRGLFRALRRGK